MYFICTLSNLKIHPRLRFYEVNLWVFMTAYHGLNIQLHSWPLLSKQKKIRGSQICKAHCCNFKGFKVRPGRDLNPGLPLESLNIGKLTHAGGLGLNTSQAELWRLQTLKPLKLQQYTLHFWKPLISFYFEYRDQERRCLFSLWYTIVNTHRFTSWNCKRVYL